jgi:hypothetical protein
VARTEKTKGTLVLISVDGVMYIFGIFKVMSNHCEIESLACDIEGVGYSAKMDGFSG